MKKVLKWLGITLGSLVGLLLLALGVIYAISGLRSNQTYNIPTTAVTVPTGPEAVAEGQRLYTIRGCVDCHMEDGAGSVMLDDPLLGRLVASNLTSGQGGVGSLYRDQDWGLAIRHGIGEDAKPLKLMPSQEYTGINDDDLGLIIAYLKNLPPVDNELPATTFRPLGRILHVTGIYPMVAAEVIDHDAPGPQAVERDATAEYGAYLAQTCAGCHGQNFSGGPIPGVPMEAPYPANLTPDPETGLGQWTEADFMRVFREGKRPDGSSIAPGMPWQAMGQMTDTELSALWIYLQSRPAQPYGNR